MGGWAVKSLSSESPTWYLKEGWRLFRVTWWPLLKAVLFGGLLLLIGVVLFTAVVITVAIIGGARGWEMPADPWLWGALVAGASTILMLICVPSFSYLWCMLSSKDYFPGQYRLWRLFWQGFRYWPRIVKLNLWALLFFLPLTVLNWYLVFRGFPTDPEAMRQQADGASWLLLLTSPVSNVIAIYATFATLEVVRSGLPALTAWKRAFTLVKREDWLRSVGVLASLGVGLAVLNVVWGELTSPDASLLQFGWVLVFGLLGLYLSFCQLALWRRAHLAGDAPDPLETSEPADGPGPAGLTLAE